MILQRDNDPKQASQSSIKIIKTKRMRENPREPQRQPRELQRAPENTRKPSDRKGRKQREEREKRERAEREENIDFYKGKFQKQANGLRVTKAPCTKYAACQQK